MHSQFNRKNFGKQIVTARAMAELTRAELAKISSLAHTTVKLAEDGDSSVTEQNLVKILRAIETLGFEFPDGTLSSNILRHALGEDGTAVTTDPSMPGMVRRLYPRVRGVHDLVHELQICGVVIEPAQRFIDLCQSDDQPWPHNVISSFRRARRFDILVHWKNGHINRDGLLHVLSAYIDSDILSEQIWSQIPLFPLNSTPAQHT